MKKAFAFIAMFALIAGFILSCQKAEGPRERRELTEAEKARCKELWEGRPDKDYTKEERRYLREVCRIPWAKAPEELVDVMRWWRDEDDHWEMMYYHINDIMRLRQTWKPEVIEALKRIALESEYVQLRERATIALHEIGGRKYLPLIKEVLRREVEERGVTPESRKTVIYWAGRILSEEGEYEYAFPYLMKAKVFRISSKRKDRRAVPYAMKALKDKDEGIRLDAAGVLIRAGGVEDREKAFEALVDILENSKDGGYVDQAIYWLGELEDERAVPVLKKSLSRFDPEKDYKYDSVLKALKKIEERKKK